MREYLNSHQATMHLWQKTGNMYNKYLKVHIVTWTTMQMISQVFNELTCANR